MDKALDSWGRELQVGDFAVDKYGGLVIVANPVSHTSIKVFACWSHRWNYYLENRAKIDDKNVIYKTNLRKSDNLTIVDPRGFPALMVQKMRERLEIFQKTGS